MSDKIVDFIAAVFNEYGIPLFENGSPFKKMQDAAMSDLAALRSAAPEADAAIERRDGVMRGLMIAIDLRDSRDEAAYDRVCNKFGTGIGAAWLDAVRMYEDESAIRTRNETVKP